MSSDKLRKYLAYYRKTLSEEPENIEARLRLAALFREMERPTHAIEEYGTAAKLLASEGLPLEAIAACKAILELDPSHKETQFFLARLYARVPEATGNSVRVAQPVDPEAVTGSDLAVPVATDSTPPEDRKGATQSDAAEPAITLERRKSKNPQLEATVEGEYRDVVDLDVDDSQGAPMDGPTLEMEAQDRDAVPREGYNGSGAVAGVDDDGQDTRLQHPEHQAALRDESIPETIPEDDRQTIELGVFDLDSLELEERETGQWRHLKFLDQVDEPDTQEVDLGERDTLEADGMAKREFRISALPRIPLFSQLPRKVFVEVLDAMEHERYPASTEVLRPGDPAGCLYVIVSGRARIEKDFVDGRTKKLAILGEGEIFGEFRLLTGRGDWARVVAETELELLVVRDEVIYRIGREYPKLWQVMWSFYYRRMLNHAMASSTIFEMLNREERELVCRHFELDELGADQTFFECGDEVDFLALIVRGTVSIEVPDGDDSRVVDTLKAGAFLGVGPCAQEAPVTATARTETDVVFYRMPGTIFRELMYGLPEVAEAVRGVVEVRLARTSSLNDDPTVTDRI